MIPDEFCPHVEIGTPSAGGILFNAENPPVAVEMCAECLNSCRVRFSSLAPMPEDEHVLMMSDEEIKQSIIADGGDPDQVARDVRQLLTEAVKTRNERG